MFSVYSPITLPYEYVTNWNLEVEVARIHNIAMLVHDYGGNSVAIELPTKSKTFDAFDVVKCFEAAGYTVVITLSSKYQNVTIFNLEWRRKDGRKAENQSNLHRTSVKSHERQVLR